MSRFPARTALRRNPRADAGRRARRSGKAVPRARWMRPASTLGEITVWSTPRRLALIARGLPRGDRGGAAKKPRARPTARPMQAIDGFCRKNGVTRDQLEVRDVKGRETYFAVIEKPGRAVKDVLAEAIPAIIRDFPLAQVDALGRGLDLAPKACAGCARCRASSRCWAKTWSSARSTASPAGCGHAWATASTTTGDDHHRLRPTITPRSCAPAM